MLTGSHPARNGHWLSLPLLALLAGCGPQFDSSEWLPGGDTTNVLLLGSQSFLRPAQNLDPENEAAFFSGNGFFNQAWVQAPASTTARDGLGPFFNARSCSGCHFRDGRAALPESGAGPFVGVLLRLSVPGPDGPVPDPVYGGQLQDQAVPGLPPEAIPQVSWTEEAGTYPDGTGYHLVRPTFTLLDPAYGPIPEDLVLSPRAAPHMVGLGLLEAIPESRLLALADEDDADGDGISGRISRVDGNRIGRFGWKAEAPGVAEQSAGAFAGDMGLTSPLVDHDDCTDLQPDCLEAEQHGPEPEVEPHIFERVVVYARTIAPPVRRAAEDPEVLAGRALFRDIGCDSCHTPRHQTVDEHDEPGTLPDDVVQSIPALAGQTIWPYTDLLLHDMGPDLADQGSDAPEASEWRTPPLWGIGLIPDVNGHSRYLHDGRARNLEEAILWHGGEAEASREAFRHLDAADRSALLRFVADL